MVAAALAGALPADQDVKPVQIAEVPHYCEGVVFDYDGYLYVSDTQGKTIYRLKPGANAKPEKWAETPAPNGHKVLADGTHLVCDAHAVLHLDATGKTLGNASSACDGQPLRAPNDLTLDPKGGFYFTDPGGSNAKKPIGTVHYVDGKGKTSLAVKGLAFPNGIVLRPEGKTLLVGESSNNRVLAFDVLEPGKLGPLRIFANLPAKQGEQIDNQPDGMCLDEAGNLYVAHYGMRQVQVLSLEGKLLRRYVGGNLTTSNVAFGGPRMDQLYITGGLKAEAVAGGLFRLDLPGVPGLVILPKR